MLFLWELSFDRDGCLQGRGIAVEPPLPQMVGPITPSASRLCYTMLRFLNHDFAAFPAGKDSHQEDPMSESLFKLHSDYQPAGDQPTAIAQLIEGIDDGLGHQTLLGVTGSGKTFTMANVIEQTGRPTIIMAPNKTCLLYTSDAADE